MQSVSLKAGTADFLPMSRLGDNYFLVQSPGGFSFPAEVEVTSILGDTVRDVVPGGPVGTFKGGAQFPVSSLWETVGGSTTPQSQIVPSSPGAVATPDIIPSSPQPGEPSFSPSPAVCLARAEHLQPLGSAVPVLPVSGHYRIQHLLAWSSQGCMMLLSASSQPSVPLQNADPPLHSGNQPEAVAHRD